MEILSEDNANEEISLVDKAKQLNELRTDMLNQLLTMRDEIAAALAEMGYDSASEKPKVGRPRGSRTRKPKEIAA